ncbi:MAG: DUF1036 domain-containing protein [Symploca sp. SIO3C6]|uniref:DUF1036 domain-containing protein n=1 Tax=Symploca sp. SIO1C4 TaxID=2607765 RepID=A0A6B3N054_9CYAN|nr:DUF1036 domain-containing protein [Symploca sp. SIO3C6]NER27066.1 DUF1036 domain-containing protein [Symploca sp. SIO1C4]NET07227.1 DUF1036 domain-containing protein [Symploca sp. SIO2B6]NET53922.1 DUF1036 domain-containing protein [Merismopedia sp. SIO2A8]
MNKQILSAMMLLPMMLVGADSIFASDNSNIAIAQVSLKSASTWQPPLVSKPVLTKKFPVLTTVFFKQAQVTTLTRCNNTSSAINTGYARKISSDQWSQVTGWITIKPQKCSRLYLGEYSDAVRIYKNTDGKSDFVETIILSPGDTKYTFQSNRPVSTN